MVSACKVSAFNFEGIQKRGGTDSKMGVGMKWFSEGF